MITSKTKVILFQVKNSKEKIQKILQVCTKHLEDKKGLLLKVETFDVATYIDNLLWESIPESFIPHKVIKEKANIFLEQILIGCEEFSSPELKAVFNLSSKPIDSKDSYTIIYDFEDLTSPEKKKFFELRYKSYVDAKLHVISL